MSFELWSRGVLLGDCFGLSVVVAFMWVLPFEFADGVVLLLVDLLFVGLLEADGADLRLVVGQILDSPKNSNQKNTAKK